MDSVAALAANLDAGSIALVASTLVACGTAVGVAVYLERRRGLRASARQAAEESRRGPTPPGPFAAEAAMRERAAFDQHMEASKTGVAKMRREMEMLEIQLKLAAWEVSKRQDMRDYHDLMMDKTRLEIESLRLHIKEQRKRLDEFGTQDE